MKAVNCGLSLGLVFVLSWACCGQGVVITEVAWSGTAASSADEWIELYNAGSETVDLAGWSVCFEDTVIDLGVADRATREVRTTALEPGRFLLLERTDDHAVGDRAADVIYVGSLSNGGCVIRVVDPDGNVVDTANLEGGSWPAGTAADGVPAFASMERLDPLAPDDPSNWGTAVMEWSTGTDANGEPICGTPGEENGALLRARHAPQIDALRCDRQPNRTFVIEWLATDPDGSSGALIIDLEGSGDEGATWTGFVAGLANSGAYVGPFPVSFAIADGSQGELLVRITATDVDGWSSSAVTVATPER